MKPGGYRYSLDTNLGIVLAGILVTALLATVVLAQLSESVWRHQATNADLLLDQVARMAEEGNSTINDLNRQNREGCDSTLLSELRRRLFFADHLRDIGYVRNGALVCSAVRGVLSNPIRMDSPDYQSFRGFKVWAREQFELFNRTIEATLAAKGNFMVIYDVSSVFSLFSTPYHWQLVYQHDGRLAPVLGEQGVFRADTKTEAQIMSFSSHYYSTCSASYPYCVGVEVSNLALLKRFPGLLIMLAAACLLAGVATSVAITLLLRRHASPGNRLRRGIDNGNVYPLYQPIVNLQTGEVVGCEVLARFRDHQGALYPDQFIPLIAEMDLTWPFTRTIVTQALERLQKEPGLPDGFLVNINLYPSDIASGKVRDLATLEFIRGSRLQLNFEITEDQQLDSQIAHETLLWLRAQGHGLAVDDFGTGYCNLSHLRDLMCDTLKIDRSFITGIEEGGVRAAIAPIVVHLADELQLKVVAEGIENEAQRDIVLGLGVQYGQGWLYGKPMAADDLVRVVEGSIVYPGNAASVVNG